MDAPFDIRLERPEDAPLTEAVVAGAFGPGRLAKTAERLRERARPRPDLSFTAWRDGQLVGTVRLWSVCVAQTAVVFLGPIAVDRAQRSGGVGAALIQTAVAAAEAAGESAVLLVGDPPYFGPLGFVQAEGVILPGPVDPARVMVRMLKGDPPRGRVSWTSGSGEANSGRRTTTAIADRPDY